MEELCSKHKTSFSLIFFLVVRLYQIQKIQIITQQGLCHWERVYLSQPLLVVWVNLRRPCCNCEPRLRDIFPISVLWGDKRSAPEILFEIRIFVYGVNHQPQRNRALSPTFNGSGLWKSTPLPPLNISSGEELSGSLTKKFIRQERLRKRSVLFLNVLEN